MDGEHMSKYRDYNTHVFPLIWGPTPGNVGQGKGGEGRKGRGSGKEGGGQRRARGDWAPSSIPPPARGVNKESQQPSCCYFESQFVFSILPMKGIDSRPHPGGRHR